MAYPGQTWTNCPPPYGTPDHGWILGRLTSMCSRVKITGSVMNTRLDSLLMEAAMMSEFTATDTFLLRNCPRFLYITNTSLATPEERKNRIGKRLGKHVPSK
uniref:Uncharacterized protein n=1 Tax=Oncorhynchus kisutch TaxID=8019 RepID=A0A8C7LA35_ONCKI